MEPTLPSSLSLKVWALSVAFEARLAEELDEIGLTVASFRLVGELMLAGEPVRPGELARRLGVRPPSVTAMVRQLRTAGIVTVTPDPDDRRARCVSLAPGAPIGHGLEVLARVDAALARSLPDHPAVEQMLGQLLDNLNAGESP